MFLLVSTENLDLGHIHVKFQITQVSARTRKYIKMYIKDDLLNNDRPLCLLSHHFSKFMQGPHRDLQV